MRAISHRFPRYTRFDPPVPAWCVTPDGPPTIHRFFDTSPISPSGRYLAATAFPFDDRLPRAGDAADVVIVDLIEGTRRTVARTRGWDTQLGAQAQWGGDDTMLLFNDVDPATWRPFGVRLDPLSGERKELEGTVYMARPDGGEAASPCLRRTARTQAGYGVIVPPEHVPANRGAPDDDGVYVTDTRTGRCRLLVSLRRVVEAVGEPLAGQEYAEGDFYAAHVKYSPAGDRLMLVLRWLPRGGGKMRPNLITMGGDGSDIHLAISAADWGRGGHHPNWCPDGEHVMMNLRREGAMRLVRAPWRGGKVEVLTDAVLGSGHPSMHSSGRYVVTDAYVGESVAFSDGTVPLRLIDLAAGREQTLVRIRTQPEYAGPNNELRVDPHPAWDAGFRRVAFNACPDGRRAVFVADLSNVV